MHSLVNWLRENEVTLWKNVEPIIAPDRVVEGGNDGGWTEADEFHFFMETGAAAK